MRKAINEGTLYYTYHENLCLIADNRLSGARVARELDALVCLYGKPVRIVSDNILAGEQITVEGVRSQCIRAARYS